MFGALHLGLGSMRRAGGFSPAALFSAGEVGAWYDPSDLTTMFQDVAGTTPVTTPGQTVALMLDKSNGLVLGTEVLVNGTFTGNSTTGWTLPSGSSVAGDKLVLATPVSNVTTATTVVIGKSYQWEFTVSDYVSGTVNLGFGRSGVVFGATGNGTYRGIANSVGATTAPRFLSTGAANASIDNISVRELPGNHATQATAASRPTYQIDGGGRHYLAFDGVDDGLATGSVDFTATDKMTVFAGVRKLEEGARVVVELSDNINNNNDSLAVFATGYSVLGARWSFTSKGTILRPADTAANFAAPITNVVTGIGNISGDVAEVRVNGVSQVQNVGDQGTGSYGNYPLFVGRRGGTSLPLNGHIYGLIVRGAATDAANITSTETWLNGKTGAY